jgi:hypothetical protein
MISRLRSVASRTVMAGKYRAAIQSRVGVSERFTKKDAHPFVREHMNGVNTTPGKEQHDPYYEENVFAIVLIVFPTMMNREKTMTTEADSMINGKKQSSGG